MDKRNLQPARGIFNRQIRPRAGLPGVGNVAQLPSIAIRLLFVWARSVFGKMTVRTPFLNEAFTLSSAISGPSDIRRSKRP